jgi:sulfur carrier protein
MMSQRTAAFRGRFTFRPHLLKIMEAFVQILVNGETATIDEMSLLHYLESIPIDPRRVAVELNLDILPKGEYGSTLLRDGDRLEIVHFVGGG